MTGRQDTVLIFASLSLTVPKGVCLFLVFWSLLAILFPPKVATALGEVPPCGPFIASISGPISSHGPYIASISGPKSMYVTRNSIGESRMCSGAIVCVLEPLCCVPSHYFQVRSRLKARHHPSAITCVLELSCVFQSPYVASPVIISSYSCGQKLVITPAPSHVFWSYCMCFRVFMLHPQSLFPGTLAVQKLIITPAPSVLSVTSHRRNSPS